MRSLNRLKMALGADLLVRTWRLQLGYGLGQPPENWRQQVQWTRWFLKLDMPDMVGIVLYQKNINGLHTCEIVFGLSYLLRWICALLGCAG